jgi:hypothetical protein
MNQFVSSAYRTFLLLGIYGIAMGFLEGIVVVYLRELYFPEGFSFPLSQMPSRMLSVEWLREVATIVMLVSIGMIAGKNFLQRFSYFLYSFAIWDIFYYIALKLLLDWPPSLLTWDLLFLIPVAWVGPVLAPVICSLVMILFAFLIVGFQERGYPVSIRTGEWASMISGAFIIFCMFIWDYSALIIRGGYLSGFWKLASNEQFLQITSHYQPTHFNWYLFGFGILLILSALLFIFRRTRSAQRRTSLS